MVGNLFKMMKPSNPQEALGISSKKNNGNCDMATLRIPKYREIFFCLVGLMEIKGKIIFTIKLVTFTRITDL